MESAEMSFSRGEKSIISFCGLKSHQEATDPGD